MGYGKQGAEVNVSPVRPAQRRCRDVLLCYRHPGGLANPCILYSEYCFVPLPAESVSLLYIMILGGDTQIMQAESTQHSAPILDLMHEPARTIFSHVRQSG